MTKDIDMISKPPHYNQGKIECHDFMKDKGLTINSDRVCILRYITRYRFKGTGVQDLQKALWYAKELRFEYEDLRGLGQFELFPPIGEIDIEDYILDQKMVGRAARVIRLLFGPDWRNDPKAMLRVEQHLQILLDDHKKRLKNGKTVAN